MAERAHSKVGASSAHRWWNCPGSVALSATIPKQPPSPYAEEGTAAHEMAERCINERKEPAELVGFMSSNGWEFDDDMAEAVGVYLGAIAEDLEKYGLTWDNLECERGFQLTHIDEDAFGTNDANLPVLLRRLIVYDFKYGSGHPVEVVGNKQMMYYGLGANVEGDYETIELVVVQPRAYHPNGPVRRWELTVKELEEYGKELKEKIAETRKPNATLATGDWCRFCPALAICPKVRKNVEETALTDFKSNSINLPSAETLTRDQLIRVLNATDLIDAWLKSVAGYALSIAQNGEKLPGFKLVKKRSNRQWIDVEVIKGLEGELGKDIIYQPPKLRTPAQLEKILGKESKEQIAALCHQPDNGVVLVAESDKRKEVPPQALADFSEVVDES